MPTKAKEQDKDRLLGQLGQVAEQMKLTKEQDKALRRERNQLIVAATDAGATEREVAITAGVSGSFAHRVKKHRGVPPSGGDT